MNAIEQIQVEIQREKADSYFSGLKRMNSAIDTLRQSANPADHPKLLKEATRRVEEMIIHRECMGWGVVHHTQFYTDYNVPPEVVAKIGGMVMID